MNSCRHHCNRANQHTVIIQVPECRSLHLLFKAYRVGTKQEEYAPSVGHEGETNEEERCSSTEQHEALYAALVGGRRDW